MGVGGCYVSILSSYLVTQSSSNAAEQGLNFVDQKERSDVLVVQWPLVEFSFFDF